MEKKHRLSVFMTGAGGGMGFESFKHMFIQCFGIRVGQR